MMEKSMTGDEAVMSEIKIDLFQEFSKVVKFKKSITNSVWIWKCDHSLVLSINMKFVNLIKVWMKEIKLKHGEALISKLAMFFAICDECHIKDGPIMKTADLMAKYVPVNTYCMPISRTLIDMNLKNVKTYLNSISQNKC